MPSELLLEWGSWNIIHAVWLFAEWCISDKWYCPTTICCLWCHGVHTNNHGNDTTVEKQESNCTDEENAVEKYLVIWFPFDVAIFIDLRRHSCSARSDQNHNKLDQK